MKATLNTISELIPLCVPPGEPDIFSTEYSQYLGLGAVGEMRRYKCVLPNSYRAD